MQCLTSSALPGQLALSADSPDGGATAAVQSLEFCELMTNQPNPP